MSVTIKDRIVAHRSAPDVYDPPTFEAMADRIEELEAELEETQKRMRFAAECLLTLSAYTKGDTPYTVATLGKGEDTLSIRFREGETDD